LERAVVASQSSIPWTDRARRRRGDALDSAARRRDRPTGSMEDSFTKPVDEVVNYFMTDENIGLTDEQVQRYQEKYGPNGTHRKALLFLTSFTDYLLYQQPSHKNKYSCESLFIGFSKIYVGP